MTINEILDEYRVRRERAIRECQERKTEIRKNIPEYFELERQALALGYEFGLTSRGKTEEELTADKENTEAIINDIREKQRKLLKLNGYPEDYLVPRFTCNRCNDTGYIDSKPKRKCPCLEQRIMQGMYASSSLDTGECFENYDLSLFKGQKCYKTVCELYQYALEYSKEIPFPELPNLIIMGMAGMGKTYTLNCIAKRAFESGKSIIKITAYNMMNEVMQSITEKKPQPDYVSCDLLLIDDLGSESLIPNITVETLFNVINERFVNCKPIVIATNLDVAEINERYGERVFSRLFSKKKAKVFILEGNDLRLHN